MYYTYLKWKRGKKKRRRKVQRGLLILLIDRFDHGDEGSICWRGFKHQEGNYFLVLYWSFTFFSNFSILQKETREQQVFNKKFLIFCHFTWREERTLASFFWSTFCLEEPNLIRCQIFKLKILCCYLWREAIIYVSRDHQSVLFSLDLCRSRKTVLNLKPFSCFTKGPC